MTKPQKMLKERWTVLRPTAEDIGGDGRDGEYGNITEALASQKQEFREMVAELHSERVEMMCGCLSGEGCGCRVENYIEALDDVAETIEKLK